MAWGKPPAPWRDAAARGLPPLLLLLSVPAVASVSFQFDAAAADRASAGKAQLDVLMADASSSGEVSCQAAAVRRLQDGCRSMNDEQQSRLAVALTNCHLEKSGLPTYACEDSMSLIDCTRPMVSSHSSIAYTSYTTFYTHAENMCFYLQSKQFQRSTEKLIDSLHRSSNAAAEQLDAIHSRAAEQAVAAQRLLHGQQAAADAAAAQERRLRAASDQLSELQSSQTESFAAAQGAIDGLSTQSAEALAGLKRDAEELNSKQQSLLGGVDKLLGLQSSLLGELMDTKSVIFFTCAVLLSLALTSAAPTARARLPLFLILTLNVLVEKLIVGFFAAFYTDPAERTFAWLWRVRKLVAVVGLCVIGRAVVRFSDLGKVTLGMLEEFKRVQVQSFAEGFAEIRELLEQLRRERQLLQELERRRSEETQEAKAVIGKQERRRTRSPAPRTKSPSQRAKTPVLAGEAARSAVTASTAASPLSEQRPDESPPSSRTRSGCAGKKAGGMRASTQSDVKENVSMPPPPRPRFEEGCASTDAELGVQHKEQARTPLRARRQSAGSEQSSTPRRSERIARRASMT